MKVLIIISCLIAVSYAGTNEVIDELITSFKAAGLKCKTEVGATDADITAIKSHEIPTTSTGKCFVGCLYQKLNFMTADGKFDQDAGYKFIAKLKDIDVELHDKFMKLANICYAEVQELSDSCETATNMLTCFEREKKALDIPTFDI